MDEIEYETEMSFSNVSTLQQKFWEKWLILLICCLDWLFSVIVRVQSEQFWPTKPLDNWCWIENARIDMEGWLQTKVYRRDN